ncbi:MAG: hypothetical protein IJ213_09155 [Bacteroidales bacterium]|nr:hypothetical protein [Bacteroidales bacterium]
MKKTLFTVLLIFISATITLGQEEWELPKSWQERDLRPIEKVEMLSELTKDTIDKLEKEYEYGGDVGGMIREVDYNIDNSGQWDTLKDGGLLWRFAVCSPKARFINVLFNKFSIPYCAKVYIYGYNDIRNRTFKQNRNQILDDSYNEHIDTLGYIFSLFMLTDTIVLEYYIPPYAKEKGTLSIDRIGHMFSYRESGYVKVGTKRNEEI